MFLAVYLKSKCRKECEKPLGSAGAYDWCNKNYDRLQHPFQLKWIGDQRYHLSCKLNKLRISGACQYFQELKDLIR